MFFPKEHRNILYSFILIILLGFFQAIQTYSYGEFDPRYVLEDMLGAVVGKVILWTLLPIIIAAVSKFLFNKQFGSILFKSLLMLSVPFSIISSYGHYLLYK